MALAGYLGCLAMIAFWPTPVDKPIHGALAAVIGYLHRHGVPAWVGYTFVEACANVLMFIPLGMFVANAFPKKMWWQLAAICAMPSVIVELGQLLFITTRFSTLSDVVTNTAGAVIGVAYARLLSRRKALLLRRRRSNSCERAQQPTR